MNSRYFLTNKDKPLEIQVVFEPNVGFNKNVPYKDDAM